MTKILIIEARFYPEISDELAKGAIEALEAAGATYDRMTVPGSFEIPGVIALSHAHQMGKYDGFVTLGCVIRGETSHYEYVCEESARGLMELSVRHGLAIGYGILTVENQEQAWARARVSEGNKGGFTANACLRMIEIRDQFVKGK